MGRNEMGHRYYTKNDIEKFREIKRLKEKGLQLRAIKTVLYDVKEDSIIPCNTTQPSEKGYVDILILLCYIR